MTKPGFNIVPGATPGFATMFCKYTALKNTPNTGKDFFNPI
jgi:hypothetical protein